MDFTALTDALDNFIRAFGAGQTRVNGLGGTLINTLLVIEICIFGLSMAAGTTQIWDVIRRVLAVGTWLYIVRNFASIAKIFVDSVVAAGLIAGGRDGDVAIIRDPSQIAGMFLDVTLPIANKFERLHWDVGEKITLGVVWVMLALPFLAMACIMFAAVVDYYLVRLLATVLVPWALNQHTRFLAEKGINGVVAAGLKLMVLGCVLAIIQPILKEVHIDEGFNWNQCWALFFTAAACGWVVWSAPRTANTLLFGSPGLSAPPLAAAVGSAAMSLVNRSATTVANAISKSRSGSGSSQTGLPPTPPQAARSPSAPSARSGSGDSSHSSTPTVAIRASQAASSSSAPSSAPSNSTSSTNGDNSP